MVVIVAASVDKDVQMGQGLMLRSIRVTCVKTENM